MSFNAEAVENFAKDIDYSKVADAEFKTDININSMLPTFKSMLYQKISKLALIEALTSDFIQDGNEKAIQCIRKMDIYIMDRYFGLKGIYKALLSESYNENCPITWIPKEILFHIISFLGEKTLWQVAPANSPFKNALLSNDVELIKSLNNSCDIYKEISTLIKKEEISLLEKAIDTLKILNENLLQFSLEQALRYKSCLIIETLIDKGADLNMITRKALHIKDTDLLSNIVMYDPNLIDIATLSSDELFDLTGVHEDYGLI